MRIWVLGEHRYGLLPVIRRVWAKRGVRVHAPYKTNYKWGYLHEALEGLENHLIAVARRWNTPEQVATLIHKWMRDQVNAIATT